MSARQAIGILGGSFDPVHFGHLAIARSFLQSGYLSELWILLTPESPHKTNRQCADYSLRFSMLERAFEDEGKVRISNYEQRLDPPFYTVRTLKHLVRHYNGQTFYLCMGEDSLANFTTWHKWEEILGYADLLVAARPDYEPREIPGRVRPQTHYVDHEPVEISSTRIRDKVKEGEDISGCVPAKVEQLIKDHNLYLT